MAGQVENREMVPVQVMLLKQRSEELQASGGQLYVGAWRGGHRADQLLPGQAQVVTVAEPVQNNSSLI